jgi:CLIP-associating protein 1/2
MEAVDFHTTDDLKHAVCKIVSLTAEPKSVEIRKTSQAVLVALFNLNTPEFSLLLADLPKNIEETASRILTSHIKNLTQDSNGTSANTSFSPYSSDFKYKTSTATTRYLHDYVNSISTQNSNGSSNDDSINSGSQLRHVIKDIETFSITSTNHYHYLNQKDRLNSINNNNNNGVTNKSLQQLQQQQQQKSNVNSNLKLDTLSKDSGVQSNGDVDSDSDGAMTSSTSTTTTTSSSAHTHTHLPNISHVIQALSSNSQTITLQERVKSMRDLTELIKAGNRPECKWNENFKNILFCLFNHMDWTSSGQDQVADLQSLALQTLAAFRELLQFQYHEFVNYVELTILKLIEKYKESPPNELSKLVEEVIVTAAKCLPPEACARVLKPLIESSEYPKNLMAIRMMQKTIDQMSGELAMKLLPDLLSCLLIAWDSPQSPVRKASVFCLVSLYMIIGESLRPHLTNLSSSKVKLLNVYINRAKETKD